jgi:hypothetical protein
MPRYRPLIAGRLVRHLEGVFGLDRSAPPTVAEVARVLTIDGDPLPAAPTATFQIEYPHGADLTPR